MGGAATNAREPKKPDLFPFECDEEHGARQLLFLGQLLRNHQKRGDPRGVVVRAGERAPGVIAVLPHPETVQMRAHHHPFVAASRNLADHVRERRTVRAVEALQPVVSGTGLHAGVRHPLPDQLARLANLGRSVPASFVALRGEHGDHALRVKRRIVYGRCRRRTRERQQQESAAHHFGGPAVAFGRSSALSAEAPGAHVPFATLVVPSNTRYEYLE